MQDSNKVSKKSDFSDETLLALYELGEVLREIHNDLLVQGYVYTNDVWHEPEE